MHKSKLLMTPGPTNVPYEVLQASATPIIHHRTNEFSEQFKKLNNNLKYVYGTSENVLTFPSSGSGMMEASIVNLFSKDDKVIVASIGVFGDRFGKIAEIFGLKVVKIEYEWGHAANTKDINNAIADNPDAKAVIVTYNETSTGISNDIEEIANCVKNKEMLFIVDAVSALGGLPLKMDAWGVDVVITASQKALMTPPGIAHVALSKKAQAFLETANLPKFYWDFKAAIKGVEKEKPDNPYTPAISLILAEKAALDMIEEEGIENIWDRHKKLAACVREGIKALGLCLFAYEEKYSSDVITAIKAPDGVDIQFEKVRAIMNQKFNIMIAGGQQKLKGKIIRIGHMGFVDIMDIINTISALEMALIETGYKEFKVGSGVTAVLNTYMSNN